jgi:hypothetical protein
MTRILLAGTTALALLAGCAHTSSGEPAAPPATATHPSGHAADMMANCPMDVPGTEVSAAAAADGETVTFTTTDQVLELRRRVHAMAAMHDEKHADGSTHDGMMGGGMMRPKSHATVFDLELGASITLAPDDPADLEKLRTAVRMHVRHMQKSGCAMMEHHHGG